MIAADPILGRIKIGVTISGGKEKDKNPSDKSSSVKVLDPMVENPDNVLEADKAFNPLIVAPDSLSQISFPGGLTPGSMVYYMNMPGQSGGVVLGLVNHIVNYDKSAAGGGDNLLEHPFFQELFERELGINVKPDIKEVKQDGVKVKAIKEKGKYVKRSDLKGLPSHNAIPQTTGQKIEQAKNIPTARQEYDAVPKEDMMGQIPGDISSLGGMLQGLMGGFGGGGGGGASGNNGNVGQGAGTGNSPGQTAPNGQTPMDRIKKKIKPELYDALVSITNMATVADISEATSFLTAGRVHTPTYLANAEELLSQVTTLEDLFVVLHRLQYDTTLFGQENLANTIIMIETAWGNANVHITFTGEVELYYANANAQTDFVDSMSSPQSSPSAGNGGAGGGGGSGGGNMFGKSAGTMQDMFKRLATNNQKEAKKMHEKLNQDDEAQKLWKFVEKTINGGNPLDPSHFV